MDTIRFLNKVANLPLAAKIVIFPTAFIGTVGAGFLMGLADPETWRKILAMPERYIPSAAAEAPPEAAEAAPAAAALKQSFSTGQNIMMGTTRLCKPSMDF